MFENLGLGAKKEYQRLVAFPFIHHATVEGNDVGVAPEKGENLDLAVFLRLSD